MASFTSKTIYDRISQLVTQITNVYAAFIAHTKHFFTQTNLSNTIDSIINTTGNIYLLSNNNTIYINTNSLCLIHGENLPDANNYAIGSLFISTITGEIYVKQIKNDIVDWFMITTN